jgi:hypothetical protein
LGADWGGDAYPFPIIGFIPIGMFPYCFCNDFVFGRTLK